MQSWLPLFFNEQFGVPVSLEIDRLASADHMRTLALMLLELGPYCTVCGNPEHLRRCGGCMWEAYCSAAHQKEDWQTHKDWRAASLSF
jgi:hypothetical protein